jgi:hypothetical protein
MKLSLLLVSIFLFLTTPLLSAQTQPEVFDVTVYEGIYPDIFNAYGTGNTTGATNHWVNIGLPAGRRASVIFDPVYYLNNNPSLGQMSYPAALQHFLQTGLPQGLRGSLEFDVQYYMSHNQQELANAGVTTFTGAADHFIYIGLGEGRQGSTDFSVLNYLALYPDVAVAYPSNFQNATLHWLRRGKGEGRSGTGTFTISSECTAPSVSNPRIYIGVTGPFGSPVNNSAAQPLNGSTPDLFDAILRVKSESGVQNLIVCLQSGTFKTNGAGDFDFFDTPTVHGPHHTNPLSPTGFSVNTNWHIHGQGINGPSATTVQLQDALQNPLDWSLPHPLDPNSPPTSGLEIVFLNHNFDVSGVEISDLIIDDNYQFVKGKHSSIPLNLLAVYLNTTQGNHHLHHLNVINTSGEVAVPNETFEGFPIFVLSFNASPTLNTGNLIEYVLMSDDQQNARCSGVTNASNVILGHCTGISIDNAAAEVRYNVVDGVENGIGGFLMPLVWFHDNFAFNNQGNGYITDSLNNRDVLIQYNEVRNPGMHGILVGGFQSYNDFQLQYNTVYLDRDRTTGILLHGNVTDASVINNNIIQAVPINSGNGITFDQTGNSNNQFEFNQISRGLTNSHSGSDCVFNNWDQFSVPLANFANTQSGPCTFPPEPGVLVSQIDPITSALEVYFSSFDQDIRTLTWNISSSWSPNSTDISYPGGVGSLITGGSITSIIDTLQNQPEVHLIGIDQHIYQLSWTATSGWIGKDLTSITSPPLPAAPTRSASPGGLTSLMDTITGKPETYYVGTDNHVHQFYLTGTAPNFSWLTFDVSGNTGGTNVTANSSLVSLADTLLGALEVYYVGIDQHIHQLSWNSVNGWHNYDLSAMASAPAASPGGLTALVDTLTGALEVYYVGTDRHLHQLQWSGSSGWHTFDVSANTGAAAAAIGQGTLTSFIDMLNSALELYYVGTDQHVHQASWNASTGWHTADITTTAAGSTNILSGGAITGLLDSLASAVDVFYVGTDHRVHELQWKSSTGWHDANIQPNN